MSRITSKKVHVEATNDRVVTSKSVHGKFLKTQDELNSFLVEREDEIIKTFCALLSGESILLLGPPGTAKSMLCEAISKWINGSRFQYVLNKYTDPAELYGPYSLEGYKKGVYERLTDGYLPWADVVFLDEVFKGSSAILNTTLRAINERKFRNGVHDIDISLRLLVGASNEVPPPESAKELHAFLDRFVIRHEIKATLSKAGRHRLLALPKVGGPSVNRDHTPVLSTTLNLAELDNATAQVSALPWTDAAEEALDQILDELQSHTIIPTQRRQYKSVRVAQAYAWLQGLDRVDPESLEVLQDVLWDDPSQIKTAHDIIGKIANPAAMKVNELITEMDEIMLKCNPNDFNEAATAVKRLAEIGRKFKELGSSNKKAVAAQAAIIKEIEKIKLGSFAGLG